MDGGQEIESLPIPEETSVIPPEVVDALEWANIRYPQMQSAHRALAGEVMLDLLDTKRLAPSALRTLHISDEQIAEIKARAVKLHSAYAVTLPDMTGTPEGAAAERGTFSDETVRFVMDFPVQMNVTIFERLGHWVVTDEAPWISNPHLPNPPEYAEDIERMFMDPQYSDRKKQLIDLWKAAGAYYRTEEALTVGRDVRNLARNVFSKQAELQTDPNFRELRGKLDAGLLNSFSATGSELPQELQTFIAKEITY